MKKRISFDIMPRAEEFMASDQMQNTNSQKIQSLKAAVAEIAARELTYRQLEILDMYYYQRKSIVEIANELGINKSTVSKTKKRAILKLEKYLSYIDFR